MLARQLLTQESGGGASLPIDLQLFLRNRPRVRFFHDRWKFEPPGKNYSI